MIINKNHFTGSKGHTIYLKKYIYYCEKKLKYYVFNSNNNRKKEKKSEIG